MTRRLALAAAVLLSACTKNALPVRTILVDSQPVKVEVATTAENRATGLMNRDSLAADEGMLFVYADEIPRSFWMKNTRIPLDIAFLGRDGTIVKIARWGHSESGDGTGRAGWVSRVRFGAVRILGLE